MAYFVCDLKEKKLKTGKLLIYRNMQGTRKQAAK